MYMYRLYFFQEVYEYIYSLSSYSFKDVLLGKVNHCDLSIPVSIQPNRPQCVLLYKFNNERIRGNLLPDIPRF